MRAYIKMLDPDNIDELEESNRTWKILSVTMEWAKKYEKDTTHEQSSKKNLAVKLLNLNEKFKSDNYKSVKFDQLAKHLDLQGNNRDGLYGKCILLFMI